MDEDSSDYEESSDMFDHSSDEPELEEDSSETEESEEEETIEFRSYKGYNYSSSGTGKNNLVERFSRWNVESLSEGYNFSLATLNIREKDRDAIKEIITADQGSNIMMIRKRCVPNSKSEQITDFSRDVFNHMLFDGSSLIPPLLSADSEGHRVMLALGENLSIHCRGGIFKIAQIRHIFYQLLCFADLCYQTQWEHLDLKPHNVLLKFESGSPRISICDFGYAKSYRYCDKADLVGGAGWMAPEVLMGKIYPTSTMFSVGCLMLTLLNGETILESLLPTKGKEEPGFGEECLRIYFSLFGKPDLDLFKSVSSGPRRDYTLKITPPFDASLEDQTQLVNMIGELLQLDPRRRPRPDTLLKHPWLRSLEDPFSYLHRENRALVHRITRFYNYIDNFMPRTDWLEQLRDSCPRDITDLRVPLYRIMQALGDLSWTVLPGDFNYTALVALFDIDRCITPKYVSEAFNYMLRLCQIVQAFLS